MAAFEQHHGGGPRLYAFVGGSTGLRPGDGRDGEKTKTGSCPEGETGEPATVQ